MTDVAGNQLTYYCTAGNCLGNYSFTTGFVTSTSAPQVTGVSPVNGLTQVPINAQIVVAFNEPVKGESLSQVTLSANGAPVALTSTLSNGNQMLTLVPVAGLTANTVYTLIVAGVTDLSGNAMTAPVTSTFTTSAEADLKTASVSTLTPANNATGVAKAMTIQIQFNKMMGILSLTSQTVKLSSSGATPVPAILTFNQSGTVVTITPISPLSPSTAYTVQLTSAISDLEGGTVSAFQSSFTTGTN